MKRAAQKKKIRAKKYPPGCDYKYVAQEKIYRECKGDFEKYVEHCNKTVKEVEKKYGLKFKVGVPKGWKPPKINWAGLKQLPKI